jgi:hypothetical protein
MDKRLAKRHKRQVARAKERVEISEPDLRTPEQIKAAREASRPAFDRGGMGIGRYPRNNFVHIDFRAPGEPSYRWTDTKRSRRADPGKSPSKMWRRSARPNT